MTSGTDTTGTIIFYPPRPRTPHATSLAGVVLSEGNQGPDGTLSYSLAWGEGGSAIPALAGSTVEPSELVPAFLVLVDDGGAAALVLSREEPARGSIVLRASKAGAAALVAGAPVILRSDGARIIVDAG